MVFVILISNSAKNELLIDSFHTKADRIYVLGDEEYYDCAYKLSDHLISRYPEIEKICACACESELSAEIDDNEHIVSVTFADSTFFDVFDFKLALGDKQTALTTLNGALLSETFANTVFYGEDPIGKSLDIEGLNVQVTGIIKDFRKSLFQNNDIILRMEQLGYFNSKMVDPDLSAGGTLLFILAKEGTNISAQIPDILELFKEIYWPYKMEWSKSVQLTPLRDVYFSGLEIADGFNVGNKMRVLFLILISVLILLFAVINYINLTAAQSSLRANEMSTRRLLGASGLSIFAKMIIESLVITLSAYFIALFLATELDKPVRNLLNTDLLALNDMTFWYFAVSILFMIIIGVVSGLIPAYLISKYKPIEVVKGVFSHKSKMLFSKVFITLQNIITIVLITCSLMMILQIRFMLKAKLGYNTENIIEINNILGIDNSKSQTLKNELQKLANVESVSFCRGYPLNRGNNNTITYNNKSISFQIFTGDSTYFEMMGFEIIQDNQMLENGLWFNETAMREMELPFDAVRTNVKVWGQSQVIKGVLKDFQYGAVTEKIGPAIVCYEDFEQASFPPWSFLVKVTGDLAKAMKDVESVYKDVSENEIFPAEFIDIQIKSMYQNEKNLSKILSLFALIAIVLSSLGLYAMAVYFIRQRAGEIATRKIFGSMNNQIFKKLLKSFLILVAIAFVLAVPIILYFITEWLSDYPRHITLNVWMFMAGGGLVLLIAYLTVLYESVKAANANPVESIKR